MRAVKKTATHSHATTGASFRLLIGAPFLPIVAIIPGGERGLRFGDVLVAGDVGG